MLSRKELKVNIPILFDGVKKLDRFAHIQLQIDLSNKNFRKSSGEVVF